MKFKFKLQKVMDYRENIRNEKLRLLSEEIRKLNGLIFEKQEVINGIQENKKRYSMERVETSLVQLQWIDQYIRALHIKHEKIDQQILEQEGVVNSFRQDMSAANRDFRVMERLKEKQKENFDLAMREKENKEMDELNILRQKKGI